MVKKTLKEAKDLLPAKQYQLLYLHYYTDFQKKWVSDFLEYYKSFGRMKAVSAGIISVFGEDKEIDFRSLKESSSAIADMSNPGYPESFYECMRTSVSHL
jgi:hypothetical protein